MSSEKNEKKVLSRREALKRCATLTLGVAAVAVSGASFADGYCSGQTRCPGGSGYSSSTPYYSSSS